LDTKICFVACKILHNILVKIWLQFNFWENFAKQQNNWIWLATVLEQGGELLRTAGRRGRAAASSAATRLATQLLARWASPWRPHPQQARRREDKTPSRRGKPPFPLNSDTDELTALPKFVLLTPFQATRDPPAAPPRTPQPFVPPSASSNLS